MLTLKKQYRHPAIRFLTLRELRVGTSESYTVSDRYGKLILCVDDEATGLSVRGVVFFAAVK